MSAPALTATKQAQDYLAAVEHALVDLPADDRAALLEDLALHLAALADEDDDRPIAVRLGLPATYAAELRDAAGLPAQGAGSQRSMSGWKEWPERVRAGAAARRALPALRASRRLLGELRPAWWVLRGYLVVLVPCLLGSDGVRDFPVPAPLGSPVVGLLLVAAAVVGSVILGRRSLPRPVGALVVLGGIVLAATAFVLGESGLSRLTNTAAYPAAPVPDVPTEKYPLLSRYGPVTDVLPYSADGIPLDGVLLYDQDGRPLRVGFQEWWADNCARVLDQPLAADGIPVPNSFPQSYELHPTGVSVDGPLLPPDATCRTDLTRPEVPLPVFPAVDSADEEPVAPVPGD